jgi:hypothetical protein
LHEGFQQAGCEVVGFRLDPSQTLDAQIEALGPSPDLVCLQLFGKTDLPREMFRTKHRLAAYCLDSVLNDYWLIPLTKLFDFVYVDQLASVAKFRKNGVPAKWLPLCVSQGDFRGETEKKHFLTFVGRTTPHRVKRNNLLAFIGNHYPVHVVQGISSTEMQDLFAASRVVLNENFFSGLNLRFFQALASGALLLSERGGYGVSRYFRDGVHYVGYGPHDILATLGRLQNDPDSFAGIAARGQEACRAGHTSLHRALTILEDWAAGPVQPRLPLSERQFFEAQAKYCHAIRFGGVFEESVGLFRQAANDSGAVAPQALGCLGDIALRRGKTEDALAGLEKGAQAQSVSGIVACLKLLLLCVDDDRFFRFLAQLTTLLARVGLPQKKYVPYLDAVKDQADRYYRCCILGCELLLDLKRNFDLGFIKTYEERFPEYAIEYAKLAFAVKKSSQALDLLITCTKRAGIAAEALPAIRQAIAAGVATDEHIALSAALAVSYYDFSYARMAAKALKKALTESASRVGSERSALG